MKQGYFDIHTHILPGVDDGAGDMETALRMLTMEYEDGVRHIILTPHYMPSSRMEKNEDRSLKIKQTFKKIKEESKRLFPELNLYLGNELYYKSNVLEELDAKRANTMAGSDYILSEFSTGISYSELVKAARSYQHDGYQPILAHVERYQCLQGNLDRLRELKNMGCLLQMNTENFLEGFFSANKRFCTKAVREGYIDFLGTDCHNCETRKPTMKRAVQYLEKKIEKDELEVLLYKNPMKIIEEIQKKE